MANMLALAPRWISDNMKEQLAQRWTGKLSPLNPEIEMKVKGMFAANVQIEQPLYPKSVIRISLCRTAKRKPNDRFGLNINNALNDDIWLS